jgi:hypothetical protein
VGEAVQPTAAAHARKAAKQGVREPPGVCPSAGRAAKAGGPGVQLPQAVAVHDPARRVP